VGLRGRALVRIEGVAGFEGRFWICHAESGEYALREELGRTRHQMYGTVKGVSSSCVEWRIQSGLLLEHAVTPIVVEEFLGLTDFGACPLAELFYRYWV
jgi:hypothetical protein